MNYNDEAHRKHVVQSQANTTFIVQRHQRFRHNHNKIAIFNRNSKEYESNMSAFGFKTFMQADDELSGFCKRWPLAVRGNFRQDLEASSVEAVKN